MMPMGDGLFSNDSFLAKVRQIHLRDEFCLFLSCQLLVVLFFVFPDGRNPLFVRQMCEEVIKRGLNNV